MSKLVKVILRLFPLDRSATSIVDQSQTAEGETTLRYDGRWEEALMASMYDVNAGIYLDHVRGYHCGSRFYG